jgi:hypothetical protein
VEWEKAGCDDDEEKDGDDEDDDDVDDADEEDCWFAAAQAASINGTTSKLFLGNVQSERADQERVR